MFYHGDESRVSLIHAICRRIPTLVKKPCGPRHQGRFNQPNQTVQRRKRAGGDNLDTRWRQKILDPDRVHGNGHGRFT